MGYETFKDTVLNTIRDYLPEEWKDCEISLHTRYKVNQRLEGICFQWPQDSETELSACPVIYLQDLYDLYLAGNSVEKILRYVAGMMGEVPDSQKIRSGAFSLEGLKDSVILQVINYEKNKEMLKEHPHRQFLDLAVIYRAVVIDEDGRCSGVTVTHEIMKEWGMTEEELYQRAYKRTPELFPFVRQDTGRMFGSGIIVSPGQRTLYFLSTESFRYGAAALLYPEILEMTAEDFKGSFAILPGSIHELYLINDTRSQAKAWKEVVEAANEELVDPSEWLSDSIYYYNHTEKTVSLLW